jgi:hypothetical protein
MPREWQQQPAYRTTPLYQMLTLHRALEIIPDNAYVLKTRTDLVPDAVLQFLDILENPDRSIGRKALLSRGKITVLYMNNVLFFDIGDTQYFAHRDKLLGLLDFSVFVDASANPHPPYYVTETRIFGQQYLRRSRQLSFLTSIIDIVRYMEVPLLLLKDEKRNLPRLIIGAYAIYYAALLQDFRLVWRGEAIEGDLRFRDLLTPHGPLCEEMYRSGCSAIRMDAKLRSRVLAAPDAKDRNAVKFHESLAARLRNAFDDRIERQDVEELIAFDRALPDDQRFLALDPEAIWARVPQPIQSQEFSLCDMPELQDRRCSSVFQEAVNAGQPIAPAAYAAHELVLRTLPDEQAEITFWLELAAHYGHAQAQDLLNMPRLDFTELRRRRDEWLNRTFKSASVC